MFIPSLPVTTLVFHAGVASDGIFADFGGFRFVVAVGRGTVVLGKAIST